MEERGLPGALSMEGVARPSRILRKSIHVFLQHYHYFTLTSALIAFPFSVSFLLSQDFVLSSPSSSILSSLYTHFSSLFRAAKFPLSGPSSGLFSIANLKLSQTLSSSFLTLPFTLTFLLFAKASVIQSLGGTRASLASTYLLILQTYVCTWLILLSVNATAFFLMFFAFCGIKNFSSSWCTLIVSAASAVLYSVILANAIIICNLGLVLSGVERISGPLAIVKVILMIRERASTALSLAVPVNIALAATEALFHFRVSMTFHMTDNPSFLLILEGLFIAYMYSVLLVLETTVNLMFLKSCAYEDSLAEFRDWYYFWQIHLEDGKFDFSSSQKYLIGSGL